MGQADRLIHAARRLSRTVGTLHFGSPVTHVYDPLVHAARGHRRYLRRYGNGRCRVLFLGMNPGPYGMTQTGVPFGEVEHVRNWLAIEERIDRPANEHPKRPVDGFGCTRSEVSGARLWGAIAAHWSTPEAFFRDHFIANYCPLVFMEATGRNRTPDKLPTEERTPLYAACDDHLQRIVEILEPEWVVGIGAFAEQRARHVLTGGGPALRSDPPPEPREPPGQSRLGRRGRPGLPRARPVPRGHRTRRLTPRTTSDHLGPPRTTSNHLGPP